MSVSECLEEYDKFMGEVFPTGSVQKGVDFVRDGAFYDSTKLERIIKDLLSRKLGDADAPLLDEDGRCKVYVCPSTDQVPINVHSSPGV